jgi:hypothetical protein
MKKPREILGENQAKWMGQCLRQAYRFVDPLESLVG